MTVTMIVRNQVRDFDAWKEAFDRYDRFRAEHHVRAYRILRETADPSRLVIELDFDSTQDALGHLTGLRKIWATPLSRDQLVSHEEPVIMSLVESEGATGTP